MNEFNESAIDEITLAIRGKTVIKFEDESIRSNNFLVFHFEDGSTLRIRYDWVYEWQLLEGKDE